MKKKKTETSTSITWLFPLFRLPIDPLQLGNWIFNVWYSLTRNWLRVATLSELHKNARSSYAHNHNKTGELQHESNFKWNMQLFTRIALLLFSNFLILCSQPIHFRCFCFVYANGFEHSLLCYIQTFVRFSSVNCVNNETQTKNMFMWTRNILWATLNVCRRYTLHRRILHSARN